VDTLSYKTISANKATANKEWFVADATNQVLGRFSSQVASVLRGKHKTNFTPHADCWDNVIVINADKIRLTGNKWDKKEYVTHSGYPGGFKEISFAKLMKENPTRVITHAIVGMLPDNRLKAKRMARLKVFVGEKNPYADKFKISALPKDKE
jgi:large subunit ribosomal protein L13